MSLKRKVTKEEFGAIESEDIKGLYKEDGDGNFGLELEEDKALVNALSRVKEELSAKTTEYNEFAEKLKLANAHIEELKAAHGKGKNEIAVLEESWKAKYAKLEETSKKEKEEQVVKIRKAAIDAQALKIASEICVAPELMVPVIAERLDADFHEGTPIIRVKDKDGKPSALSLTELANEFKEDETYSRVMIASKASGGATTSSPGGASASSPGSGASPKKDKKYSEMSADELAKAASAALEKRLKR